MKYFSPNILDGSVTTAKLADLAVTAAKLAAFAVTTIKMGTSITSQSGTIGISASVIIALNNFTFLMDTEVEGGENTRMIPVQIAVPSASASAPEYVIKNLTGVALLYDVEWRFVTV